MSTTKRYYITEFDSDNRRLLRKNSLEWGFGGKKYQLVINHVFPQIEIPDGLEEYAQRVLSGMKKSVLEKMFLNHEDAGTYVMLSVDNVLVAQGKSSVHPADMFRYDPYKGEKAAIKRMLKHKARSMHDLVYAVLTGPGGRWYGIINKARLNRERATSIVDNAFELALHQAMTMKMNNEMYRDWKWLKKYIRTK